MTSDFMIQDGLGFGKSVEATRLLSEAQQKANVNAIDRNYGSLGCEIKVLDRSRKEHSLIQNVILLTIISVF